MVKFWVRSELESIVRSHANEFYGVHELDPVMPELVNLITVKPHVLSVARFNAETFRDLLRSVRDGNTVSVLVTQRIYAELGRENESLVSN